MTGQDIGPVSQPDEQDPIGSTEVQAFLARRSAQLGVSFERAKGVSPVAFSEAKTLGTTLGRPTEAVLLDMEQARADAMRRKASDLEFQRAHPVLYSAMQDVRYLPAIRDDLDNLQATESKWGWIGRSWNTARDSSATGTVGMRAMIEGRDFTLSEQRQLQMASERAAAHAARSDGGFLESAISLVGSMMDSVVTGTAVGLATGPAAPAAVPAALFAQSFRLEGGNLYAELVQDGYTPAEAQGIVLSYAPFIAALDVVGFQAAAKPFRAMAGNLLPRVFARSVTAETRTRALLEAGRNYLKAVGGESSTEGLQKVVEMMGKEELRAKNRPGDPSAFDMGQAVDEFAITAKGMMVLGGIGAGGQFASGMVMAADAEHAARVFESLAQIEDASKSAGRNPDDRAAFVTEVATKHAQAPHVYIDGQQFAQAVLAADETSARETGQATASESLEKLLPGITDKVRKAEELGGDVVLPTGDFISKLGRTEIGRALFQHAKFDADGMTPAEAKAALAERPQLSEEARKEAQAAMAADKTLAESAGRVEEALYQQIRATKRLPNAKQERAAAQFYRDFVVTQAAKRGLTPEQFYERYPLRVVRGDGQQAAAFDQFAGEAATSFPAQAATKASALLRDGRDAEEVRKLTGVSIGDDGRLRFEIDDSGATLIGAANVETVGDLLGGISRRLDQVLDHPALFNAYPALRSIEVGDMDGSGGSFDRASNTIMVGGVQSTDSGLSVLLHEVQHAIQDLEGFARGGSPSMFSRQQLVQTAKDDAWRTLGKLRKDFPGAAQVVEDWRTKWAAARTAPSDAATTALDKAAQRMRKNSAASKIRDLEWFLAEAPEDLQEPVSRVDAYRRLAGEVEARNTQERRGMDAEARRSTSPESTRDVRRDESIVVYRSGPRGDAKGGFIPETLTVLLNEKADVSTFLHESAHAFLTIYGDMAAKGDAQATADLTTLLDWFGVKDVATWNAMTLEQQRKHHEKFAYSFEGYLFDGVAPNEEMRGLFDRFKVWLRAIYKTIRDNIGAAYRKEFGEPLPILTGEVRQVMDRMLASEQTIAEAEAVRNMVPVFQTQEQSKMDDGAWAAYQQMAQETRDAGVAELDRRSLGALQWSHGARSRLLKAAQAQHDDVRGRVRREVVAEVSARPEVRADRWLRTGKLINDDGTTAQGDKDQNHKLHRATVEAIVGADAAAKMEPYLRADGLSPDAVAETFGYASGEGMMRALAGMQAFGNAVDARTDERMHAEHSDLADPAEVEAAVERALHNEARARFVAAELRHLQGATAPVRVMLAAAKEAARQAIAGMPLRDVSAKLFAQAEARAARKAMDAMKKGDSAEAAEWQQKRLLQHALSTVAGEVQQDVAKELRNIARFRKPDAKLAKSRNIDLVNAARWILSRYNLGTPNQAASATKALQAVAAYDANMGAQLAPLIADAEQNGRDYRDLSVDQFRDLMGKVDGLWNDSRRDQQIRLDGKLVEKAEARERIVAQLAKAAAKGRKPVSGLLRGIGGITASLRHVESWALEMDGGQPGPVHDLLFRMLRDRYDDYLLQRKEMKQELDASIEVLPNLYGRKYEARYLKDKNGVPHVWKDRAQVIGWVLHLGNLENARKDAVGRGWVVKAKDGTADLSPVFRELQRLIDEGHVTKADMQFVQGSVWDTYEHTLKPKAQAAHKDVYGYYFTEVEAAPLELRFPDGSTEKFRGGYAPAKPDPDLEEARPGQVSADGITESGAEFADRHPSAPKGFTITRTGIDRALMHDLRMVPQSFAEELQFIHMQRAGKDLDALLNDKDIAAAIRAVDPDAIESMFQPWLSDTMRDRLMAPGGNKVVNRALVALRRNVGMAHMFGNLPNAFQQLTGLATAATYVPIKHLRAGARIMTQAGQIDRMKAASKFMRLRIDKRLGQITDDIDGALKTTWTGKAAGWTRRNAYFLQRWFQMPVDLITWFGAHDQAMAQGKTDAQAVAWADAAVRRSQGSGVAPDISRFERSSAPIRLLTQFGGFWLAQFNTLAQRHGAERATAAANVILFAGVTAGAISQALKGGWDDDDEDGQLWDDVLSWTFGETVRTGASLLPVIGPAAYVWTTGDRGGRASPMAVVSTMDQAARGFGTFAAMFDPERDVKGTDIKATGLLLATFSAFPWFSALARPASYATDMQSGNVVPSGPGDAARGLLTGSVAPGTRQ